MDCDCGGSSKHVLDNGIAVAKDIVDDGEDDEDSSDIGFINAAQVKSDRIEKMDRTVRTHSDIFCLKTTLSMVCST